MWSNVFGNLQNDLAEFAKELSAGVPTKPATQSIESASLVDQPKRVVTDNSAVNDPAPAKPTSPKAGELDGKASTAASLAREEIDKTFLLAWASSDEEDDDDDDVASEWEQVTASSVTDTLKNKEVAISPPRALPDQNRSNTASELQRVRAKLHRVIDERDEARDHLAKSNQKVVELESLVQSQSSEVDRLRVQVEELRNLSTQLRQTVAAAEKKLAES